MTVCRRYCKIPAGLAYLVYASVLIKLDEYCHSKGVTNLRIYIVDISKNVISAISKECNRAFRCGYDSTADQISNDVEKDLGIKSHLISQRFQVKAYKGDISVFREGSIICAVNRDLTPSGSDAEEIAHQAGHTYIEKLEINRRGSKYKEGEVCLPVAIDLSTHRILHSIIPSKKIWPFGRERHYREKLIACYRNALQMASDQKETIVALSVLGIDTGYLKKDLCCSALVDVMISLVESLDKMTSLRQLHIICREDDVLSRIVTLLNKLQK
ncbi:hypothetical protein CHS0354_005009 [Potamilus streckersoni]|uniref:Macro domain-containing protein n=1 Tax=Potamilus streckersoni TaxID=2493646 RepID=A0AAE0ST88_9BIVA|nr:hypothetical protein CHS0354_005009 [Potamilus streckersoni]